MATFEVDIDGVTYEVDAPDEKTAWKWAKASHQKPAKSAAKEETYDPTEGMTTTQKVLAGMGKAFVDVGRGVGQRMGMVSQEDIDAAKKLDEPLMRTGAGVTGNVLGNVASYAPLALVPGANTVLGGAALGAASGAIQPTASDESVLTNTVLGGVAGGAVPAAIRAGKAVKAAVVDPFTQAGRDRIAKGVITRAAADPDAVIRNLQNAKGATPGFVPTVGQAADDAGIASLERTVRALDPKAFDSVEKSQRSALADALRNIAGDPVKRQKSLDAANESAKKLYGTALKESMPVSDDLVRLANRPSIRRAEARAMQLGDEFGRPFTATLNDLRPQQIPIEGQPSIASVIKPQNSVDAYMLHQPKTASVAIPPERGAFFEVPPVDSVPVRDMHTMKMAMDAMMADPTLGIAGREAAAINATRNKLLDLMPDAYQQARLSHIAMNKPVHQMDVGQALLDRFVPAMYRDMDSPLKLNYDSLAKAVIDQGDDIAKSVTGLKNSTLEGTMSPEQMATLRGILADAQKMKAAEMMGRGVGSDTVQKTAMSHLAAEAGIPNWLASIARVPGGWAKRAGDVLYGNSDEAVRARLAELMANPQEAATVLQASSGNAELANALKRIAVGLGQSTVPALAAQ